MDTLIILSYAGFMALGAVFGARAGSRISLIMGSVSALLVAGGWWWVQQSPRSGFIFLTILAAGLALQFFRRLNITQKWMPAGMLLLVTSAFLGFCLVRYLSF